MLALAAGGRKGLMDVVLTAAGAEAGLRGPMASGSDPVGFSKAGDLVRRLAAP